MYVTPLGYKCRMQVETVCAWCGTRFAAKTYRSHIARGVIDVRYCSHSCAAYGRWGAHERRGRPAVNRPGHPLATKQGRVSVYRMVLYDAIGPGTHPCHWCGIEVAWTAGGNGKGAPYGALHVDHLDGDIQNSDRTNLVPACSSCNTLRGMIRAWRERTGRTIEALD